MRIVRAKTTAPPQTFVRTALRVLAWVALTIAGCARFAWADNAVRRDEARIAYDVGAAITRADGMVRFRERITLPERGSRPRSPVRLWLYADRTREPAPAHDEFSAERIYPRSVSFGGFGDLRVQVAGCPSASIPAVAHADAVRGRDVEVPICEGAALPWTLQIEGTVETPHRYGTFGHAEGAVMLGEPWYPLVVEPGDPTPALASHRIDVRWDSGDMVGPTGAFTGGSASIAPAAMPYVPLFLLHGSAILREGMSGLDTTLVTDREPAHRDAPDTPEGFAQTDPWDIDTPSAIARTVRGCITFLRSLGFVSQPGAPRPLPKSLVVVQIPERQRLAVALPGMVAVSDHAFLLLPIDRVQRFHTLAIARKVFGALMAPRVERSEARGDQAWVADFDGAVLVDKTIAAANDRRESPKDLVGFAGFHPAVDQLLYAPRVAFRSAYFHDIEELDPDREGVDRARNELPFGLFIGEKMRDRLSNGPFEGAVDAHLFAGVPLRAAAERAHGAPLDRFFETWLGPHRRLSYAIAGHDEIPQGGHILHRVRLLRRGDTSVQEPVVVELTDEAGTKARKIWDAPGAEGAVEWASDHPLADAVLDPDRRLVEDITLENNHPRFDDELTHAWRPPIFNSFAISLSVTESRPDIVLDFVMKRMFDVREAFGFSVASTALGYSGRVRYYRGLGPPRDGNRTYGGLTTGLTVLRSSNGFGGSEIPVTEVTLASALSWDTRKQVVDPKTGFGVSAAIETGVAREDDVHPVVPPPQPDGKPHETGGDPGAVHPSLSMAVRGQKLFWYHPLHVLALIAGGGISVCPALPQQQQTLSGRQLLRGYAADELIGCATTYAIVEERFTVLQGLYWNAAHLAWFRGLEMVPFVGGGLLSSRDTVADLFKGPHAEVGMGLRAFFDFAGVQPTLLSIDAAVPIVAAPRTYVDSLGVTRRRSPYGLYISFEQTF